MGYEVKIYVGERFEGMQENGHDYFSVIAMVDLCKPGMDSKLGELCGGDQTELEKYPLIRAYLRGGDKCETEDCYGKELRALPMDIVLAAAVQDAASCEYHRFGLALDLLRSSATHCAHKPRLGVVLYGY